MTLLSWLVTVVVLPLLLAEFTELGPWLARMVVHRAARRLPRSQRSRWREQWLADLEDIPGRLTKLAWALSIFLVGAGKMRRMLGAPPLSQVLWMRLRGAWQRLRSQQKPPQGSPQEIELQVHSVVQKQEVQPVTVTVEALPATVLLGSPGIGKSRTFLSIAGSSSDKEFMMYLAHEQRELERDLAQQRQEFEQWLAWQW